MTVTVRNSSWSQRTTKINDFNFDPLWLWKYCWPPQYGVDLLSWCFASALHFFRAKLAKLNLVVFLARTIQLTLYDIQSAWVSKVVRKLFSFLIDSWLSRTTNLAWVCKRDRSYFEMLNGVFTFILFSKDHWIRTLLCFRLRPSIYRRKKVLIVLNYKQFFIYKKKFKTKVDIA